MFCCCLFYYVVDAVVEGMLQKFNYPRIHGFEIRIFIFTKKNVFYLRHVKERSVDT